MGNTRLPSRTDDRPRLPNLVRFSSSPEWSLVYQRRSYTLFFFFLSLLHSASLSLCFTMLRRPCYDGETRVVGAAERGKRSAPTFSIRYRESMWHRRWLAGPSDHTRYTPFLSVTTIATTYASHGSFAWRTPPLLFSRRVARRGTYIRAHCVCVCVCACTRSFPTDSSCSPCFSFSLQNRVSSDFPFEDLQALFSSRPFFFSFCVSFARPRSGLFYFLFFFFFFFFLRSPRGCFSFLSTRARRLENDALIRLARTPHQQPLYKPSAASACLSPFRHAPPLLASASNHEFLASSPSFVLLAIYSLIVDSGMPSCRKQLLDDTFISIVWE